MRPFPVNLRTSLILGLVLTFMHQITALEADAIAEGATRSLSLSIPETPYFPA